MTERLLDYDHETGLKQFFSTEDGGDTWRIRYEQDITPLLETNKADQTEGLDRRSEMWHAARIPAVVQMEWLTKHGVDLYNPDHGPGVRRLLNDPDYRHLRVNEFKI